MASAAHTAVSSSSASSPRASSSSTSPHRAYISWQRHEYPIRLWYCVACGITLFILANLWSKLRRCSRSNALLRRPPSFPRNIYTGPISWRRLPAAIGTAWNIAAYRWTIPYGRNHVLSLTELCATTGYAAAVLTWSFVNSDGGQKEFWAQRTGAIAFTQIPLLPLLAGKNNLLSLVTGISYERLNIMHRAVARLNFILVLLHTLSKIPFSPAKLVQDHYLTGVIGTAAFGALFLSSLRPVRTHAFELFMVLHVLLVAVYLTGAYLHQPKQGVYIWLAVGFWGLDRVFRVLKVIFINTGNSAPVKAVIEHVSSDAVRITLPDRRMNWTAGQHVFLNVPGVSTLPFESHPFTIASIREPTIEGHKNQPLVFIIRTMNGFTRHLYNHAVSHPGKPVAMLVDGPYGRPPSVDCFSTVVLLAGGSGVSFTLPLLLEIISSARRNESPVRRVLFVWSIKHRDDIKLAYDGIRRALKNLPRGLSVDVRIHVTRTIRTIALVHAAGLSDEHMGEKDFSLFPVVNRSSKAVKEKVVLASPVDSFQVCLGRPDLFTLVRDEVECAQGPVSVNASGPLPFTNAVRRLGRADFAGPMAVLRGAPPINFYIESFGTIKRR